MALADLNVRLGLITKQFEQNLKGVDKKLRRFQRSVEGIGQDLTQSITLPLAGLGAASLTSFAQFEQGAKALQAVTKDAKSVQEQLEDLREVAKLPGLGFQEAVQGSARLQAVGLSADQAAQTLTSFGNAVARSGGGRVELEGALVALTQIASKGKISAEEINQLNERIFEIRPALEAAFGTSNSEELQKLGISSEEFIAKVTSELGKLERVQGGLANSFENFGDSVRTNLARVGEIINESFDVGGLIERFDKALTSVVDTFSNLDKSTQRNIVRAAAFAAALGPGLLALGKIVSLGRTSIATLQLLTTGFKSLSGGALLAVDNIKKLNFKAILTPQVLALTAAVGAAVLIWKEFTRRVQLANAAQKAAKDIATDTRIATESEMSSAKVLIGVIEDETTSREAKINAINKLKEISPEYFGQIDAENAQIGELKSAYDKLTQSVFLSAQQRISEEKAVNVLTREAEKLNEINDLREQAAQAGEGFNLFESETLAVIERKLARRNEELQSIQKEKNAIQEANEAAVKGLLDIQGTSGETSFNKVVTEFDRTDSSAKKISETIKQLNRDLAAVGQKEIALGGGFDGQGERLETLAAGVEKLLNLGAGADNTAVQGFISQIKSIRGSFGELQNVGTLDLIPDGVDGKLETINTDINQLGITSRDAFAAYGTGISQSAEASAILIENAQALGLVLNDNNKAIVDFGALGASALNSFGTGLSSAIAGTKKFGTAVLETIGDIIKILVQQGIAAIIANTLKVTGATLGPFAIGVAAAAGAAASALFKKAVGLADGGIVPPGFPNDSFPARLTSGEAVIPLDRLSSLAGIGSNSIQLGGEFILRGDDLYLQVRNAEERFNRFS